MYAGQTLVGTNGLQVALFPLDILLVTQTSSPSSLSHCCGHPTDYVGTHAQYPVYAPFDCVVTWTLPGYSNGNEMIVTSLNEVNYATGVGYVSVAFVHNNNAPPPVGTVFRQGQLIYYTGVSGMVTGDHVHIDQGVGANLGLTYYGYSCAYGNPCWALQNSALPTDIFFINGTSISQTLGLNFKEYQGGIPGPGPGPGPGPYPPGPGPYPTGKKKMPLWMILRRRKKL